MYYINKQTNEVHFSERPFGDGYKEITEDEAMAIVKPAPTIDDVKRKKIAEIEAAKTARFDEDVTVKIGNKNYTIIGGLEAYDKYTKAYEIAKRMGITKGKIVVREGVVEVNEAQIKKVLLALDTKNYRAEIKAGYLRKAAADAQTIEEVEAVKWDVQP